MAKRLVKLRSLEFVSKIVCKFPAFDGTSAGTREFLRRVGSTKLKETNRKCEIKHEVLHDGSAAHVEFAFDDGSKETLQTSGLSLNQITHRMNQRRGQIMVVDQYKQNPGAADEMKKIEEHYKTVNDILGFHGVLFEIPTGKGLTSIPIEKVPPEEVEKLDLVRRLYEEE